MVRTVVIGCNGDIGNAVVSHALSKGHKVVGLDRHNNRDGTDGVLAYGRIDITSTLDVGQALASAAKALGGLDVLVNAAGIIDASPLGDLAEETFQDVLDINLLGAFRLTRAVMPLMAGENGGSIVHISSMHARRGVANRSAYAASKGGLEAFIRATAVELGPKGISINAVAPGPVGSGMGNDSPDRRKLAHSLPTGREASLEEVARIIMVLADPGSRIVTGQVWAVDGGATQTSSINL